MSRFWMAPAQLSPVRPQDSLSKSAFRSQPPEAALAKDEPKIPALSYSSTDLPQGDVSDDRRQTTDDIEHRKPGVQNGRLSVLRHHRSMSRLIGSYFLKPIDKRVKIVYNKGQW